MNGTVKLGKTINNKKENFILKVLKARPSFKRKVKSPQNCCWWCDRWNNDTFPFPFNVFSIPFHFHPCTYKYSEKWEKVLQYLGEKYLHKLKVGEWVLLWNSNIMLYCTVVLYRLSLLALSIVSEVAAVKNGMVMGCYKTHKKPWKAGWKKGKS